MTEQLVSFANKNAKLGDKKKVQMILVGYDGTPEGDRAYLEHKHIPFPVIKMDERESLTALISRGDTGFIPNVVLLKADGTFVSNESEAVMKKLEELTAGES